MVYVAVLAFSLLVTVASVAFVVTGQRSPQVEIVRSLLDNIPKR